MLRNTTLVAHRGYSGEAPENTIFAFMLAISRGYTHIEFDVQLTKDGVPVVIHDDTLERTTDGTGRVDDSTYAELAKLDAGSWHDPSFVNHRIPTLEETLIALKGLATLHIELKSSEKELPLKVANLLIDQGWIEEEQTMLHKFKAFSKPTLVISSFNRSQLLRSMDALPDTVIHELLVEKVSEESLSWASAHNVRSYHPNGNDITPKLVRKARKMGLRVGAWWPTRADQNAHAMRRTGAHYAFVDSPSSHEPRPKQAITRLLTKI